MKLKFARCAALAACVALAAARLAPGQGIILNGVQPAALDQPQINAIYFLGTKTTPEIGETEDPLGGLLGGDDVIRFFNVTAYLDTGASGILISTPTATALHIARESVNGVQVIYSDVGVAGTDDFNVSIPLRMSLAHFIPGLDMDQFLDVDRTIPVTTPYSPPPVPVGPTFRAQVGPYVPTVENPGSDDIDQLIELLSGEQSALDVIGMPAMKGKVMVIDPSGVKQLGLLFEVLGGVVTGDVDITDLTDADLDDISSAGIKTYLYSRSTAPVFDAGRLNDPGIPDTQFHVQLSYGSFDRFTEVHLLGSATADPTLPSPVLEHNPFIGKNPVALLEGTDAGNAPGITIKHKLDGITKSSEGNWLLDTGAAASILSKLQAENIGVVYGDGHGPGDPETATPILVDKLTGVPLPDQFTLVLGGIGGQTILAGFFIDSLTLPTVEATTANDENLNFLFTHVPVLVGDITVVDPNDPTKKITLDGIFGMNMLIESINIQTDNVGNITDLGAPSPAFFQWITFDESAGLLGLTLDPSVVAVPEPGSLAMLLVGAGLLGLRHPKKYKSR